MDSVFEQLRERFGGRAEANIEAVKRAYRDTAIEGQAMVKEPTWRDLEVANIVTEAGNASQRRTGDWRSDRPILDKEKCNK